MNDLSPDGIGQADRPGNERYSCAGANRRLRNCMSLPPRRPVSDEPDRVDRLICRPRGDNDMPPAERTRISRGRFGRFAERVPAASACSIASTIAGGSAMRPGPNSPQAIGPDSGPTNRTPSSFRRSRLRRVAGCSHILTFIAGAASTRLSVASKRVVARSSARPGRHPGENIRARRRDHDQVGGARQLDMADRRFVSEAEQVVADRLPAQRRRRKGEMNCRAAAVMTTRTVAPRSLSRRINSSDL